MKLRKNRKANILLYFTLLVTVFLAGFSVVYAYYTSTAGADVSLSFKDLETYFYYWDANSEFKYVSSSTLVLYPTSDTLRRGEDFYVGISTDGGATVAGLKSLSLWSSSGSCSAYFRIFLDAYLSTDTEHTGTNYGQYFSITSSSCSRAATTGTNGRAVYYLNAALAGDSSRAISGINYGTTEDPDYRVVMTLLENTPNEMLGKDLIITISYEAVQSENEAFKTVFDDEYGYSSEWT